MSNAIWNYHFLNQTVELGLTCLRNAVDWLSSLGIQLSSERISSYERDINSLIVALKRNDISSFTNTQAFERVANSFYEASQLIDIYRGLSNFPSSLGLQSRLRSFIRGPLSSAKEKANGRSHMPRDFGFELFMSSVFGMAGFAVDFDQRTDIVAGNGAQSFLVECKRPRLSTSFKPAIKEAASQLKRHLGTSNTNDSNQLGVIAVSVDLLVHRTQEIVQVPDEQGIEFAVNRSMKDLISSYSSSWLRLQHPQILGVLLLVQVSAVLLQSQILTRCKYLRACNIIPLSSTKGQIFKHLVDELGSAMLRLNNAS